MTINSLNDFTGSQNEKITIRKIFRIQFNFWKLIIKGVENAIGFYWIAVFTIQIVILC